MLSYGFILLQNPKSNYQLYLDEFGNFVYVIYIKYLCRKRITVDRVFGAHFVLLTIVYMYLVHLIFVRQRSAGDVYVIFGSVL